MPLPAGPSDVSVSKPTMAQLVDEIRVGGPLARLFRRLASEQTASAKIAIRCKITPASLREVMAGAKERLSQACEQSPLMELRECAEGCSACCHTSRVDVTPLEALLVADHLENNSDQTALEQIKQRLRLTLTSRNSLPIVSDQQFSPVPCPMLNEKGACSVYEARPLVCAGVFSLSRSSCEHCLVTCSAQASVPVDQPAKVSAMGVSGGLQRAIVDANLDGNLYELCSILLCILETPSAFDRWIAGDDIFQGCHCTDAHSSPRTRRAGIRIDEASQPRPTRASKRRRAKHDR